MQNGPLSSDRIDTLPVDETVPSHNEVKIIESLFKEKPGAMTKLVKETKELFAVALLFILLSLPQTDGLIKKFFTTAETSPYILIAVKAGLFAILYFVLKNIYLVRKSEN